LAFEEAYLIHIVSTWVTAGFFALTILIWSHYRSHMEPKELWKVLLVLSLLYTIGYGTVSIYYTMSLAIFHRLPHEIGFYGKSFPAIIALFISASLLIIIAYLASLTMNRGNEAKALKDVFLGGNKTLTFYVATVMLMFLIVILGPGAYYTIVNEQVVVMYDPEVLLAIWTAVIAAISPIYMFFRNVKYYIGILELRRAIESVILLVYLQVLSGSITLTIVSLFRIQIYWIMNIVWLIISASVIFSLYSALVLPYVKIRGLGFVSSGYSIVYKKVKHETLLIEYNPRVFYGDKVISMILSSGHKNIVITGLPSKPVFRLIDSLTNVNTIKIPITVSGVNIEGVSITNLSLLFHTIVSFLSKQNTPTLIIIDDLTDLIIANDIRMVYILISQLLEIIGNNSFYSLLNAEAFDTKSRALIEGLFSKIVHIDEKGEIITIK